MKLNLRNWPAIWYDEYPYLPQFPQWGWHRHIDNEYWLTRHGELVVQITIARISDKLTAMSMEYYHDKKVEVLQRRRDTQSLFEIFEMTETWKQGLPTQLAEKVL